MLVALDTRLDENLLQEGLAREVVRAVQDARKHAALHISDRISVVVAADTDYAAAVEAWREYIMAQTLATKLDVTPAESLSVTVRKVS